MKSEIIFRQLTMITMNLHASEHKRLLDKACIEKVLQHLGIDFLPFIDFGGLMALEVSIRYHLRGKILKSLLRKQ